MQRKRGYDDKRNWNTESTERYATELSSCLRKVSYVSERIAKREGDSLGVLNGKRFRSYKCPYCKGFHLASEKNHG